MTPKSAKPRCALISVLPVLLLAACASKPAPLPVASICPTPPASPSLSTPLPQESYSLNAARLLRSWEKKLMGTPLMSAP